MDQPDETTPTTTPAGRRQAFAGKLLRLAELAEDAWGDVQSAAMGVDGLNALNREAVALTAFYGSAAPLILSCRRMAHLIRRGGPAGQGAAAPAAPGGDDDPTAPAPDPGDGGVLQ